MTSKARLLALQDSPADETPAAMETADEVAQRAQQGDTTVALAFLSRKGGQPLQE